MKIIEALKIIDQVKDVLPRIKLDIKWAFRQLGVRKWLVDRALHVPEAKVKSYCISATQVYHTEMPDPDAPAAVKDTLVITPAMWRSMEKAFSNSVYDGVVDFSEAAVEKAIAEGKLPQKIKIPFFG